MRSVTCLLALMLAFPGGAQDVQSTVVVRITGLCTFVDQFDTPPSGKLMPFDLHLINGRGRDHIPVIVYEDDFALVDPTDRSVRRENEHSLFELRGERLFMTGVNTGDSQLNYREDEVTCKTLDKGSLAALPRLRDILRRRANDPPTLTRAHLHRDFVGPHLRWPSIAAVTDISFGTLRTEEVSDILWRFVPRAGPASPHRQYLAQEVIWTFVVNGNTLTIQTARIGSNDERRDLVTLKTDDTGEIHFTIANAARSDFPILLGAGGSHVQHRFDEHFTAYYDFLIVPRDENSRPRPEMFEVCERGGDAAVGVVHSRAHRTFYVLGGLNCGPDRLP